MNDIKSVVVLGSGVMGAGIAAQVANAGISVTLLDLPKSGLGNKNALAKDAIAGLLKTDPAPLMDKKNADLITPGNFDDDLHKVKDADWVVEVVIEKLDIKQELYEKLEKLRGNNTIISSNTSTIPLKSLVEGRSDDFKKHFLITHFFNPPRYMRLLELVRGEKTADDVYKRISDFCDRMLGKGIVDCNDTPGFIANRIGTYWLQTAMLEAIEQEITVEEADALFSKPLGIPKTGVFGLMDLVGIDLMPLIGQSMKASLPKDDAYVKGYSEPGVVLKMIEDGYTGRKGKGGFYRLNKESGQKVKEAKNLQTGAYAKANKEIRFASLEIARQGLNRYLGYDDKGANYVWTVLSKVLVYTANLVGEIAEDIYAIDQAMKLGYNWKYGPFELLDRMGAHWFAEKLKGESREVPEIVEKVGIGSFYRVHSGVREFFGRDGTFTPCPRADGVLLLSDIKLKSKPIAKNASAALWDIGDGVVCFEFTSKQNSVDLEIMKMIEQTVEIVKNDYKALVIHNEGANFSVGANLGLALFAANVGAWDLIHELVHKGQVNYGMLKYAPFPVVAAPSGLALGGGCEIVLHCDAVQAHAETYIGLVEVGVGLVPAWGGCKEMLHRYMKDAGRFGGGMMAVGKVFEQIGTAQVAKSAAQAKAMKFLNKDDRITMNRDRLLADAKAYALERVEGYKAPEPIELSLPGASAKVAMSMAVKGFVKAGKASPYDEEISKKLSTILSGGDTDMTETESEEYVLKLERDAFMTLVRDPRTLARMEHILETGKPLRN